MMVKIQKNLERKSLLHNSRLCFVVNASTLSDSLKDELLCEGALPPHSLCCSIVSRNISNKEDRLMIQYYGIRMLVGQEE